MKLNKKITCGIATMAAAVALSSCTGEFDKWNTDRNSATEEDMSRDNWSTGGFFAQMEHNVFIVGLDKGGAFQITDMLTGGLFSGYFSNIKASYDVGSLHNAHYLLPDKWVNQPFNDTYTNVMQPWSRMNANSEQAGTQAVTALGKIVKVFGMARITDMYGPIPYSKFGTTLRVPYDSQEEVYRQFFNELDDAINVLTEYYNANSSSKILAKFDFVFSGDTESWIKFANTLRLRLALRVCYADESLARTEAQKSIDCPLGFMEKKVEHSNGGTYTYINPFWEVTQSWGDMRMGADIESYLTGYNDPRATAYFAVAKDGGGIHGVYPGLKINNQSDYTDRTSAMNVESNSSMQWMSGAESFFLRAEAKLRWDMGATSAKDLYEQGIRTSFSERGVGGADTYIADSESKPAAFSDNSGNGRDASALSTITIAWDESAQFEQKLERIITQKYLAIFPDGQEAWSEYRRTGYPKLFNIDNNASSGAVSTTAHIKRLRFPSDEYSNNAANVQAAASLLGGSDNGGTKLWWDKK